VTGGPRSDDHEEAGVHASVLASVYANNEGGAYLTFAFPIILFAVIASVLYVLLFGRPHRRVPPRRIAATAHAGPPSAGAARAAAVASGLPTAAGGGSAESAAEPAGAHRDATTTDDRGNVSGGTADGEQGTTEQTEAGE
jgi:hypothetical protein